MELEAERADTLWLGVDGLLAPLSEIEALLVYRPAWDRRISAAYGRVPDGVRAVVLLRDGSALPSRRALDDLDARWAAWRAANTADQDDEPVA